MATGIIILAIFNNDCVTFLVSAISWLCHCWTIRRSKATHIDSKANSNSSPNVLNQLDKATCCDNEAGPPTMKIKNQYLLTLKI
jgi:hypothetical protein